MAQGGQQGKTVCPFRGKIRLPWDMFLGKSPRWLYVVGDSQKEAVQVEKEELQGTVREAGDWQVYRGLLYVLMPVVVATRSHGKVVHTPSSPS